MKNPLCHPCLLHKVMHIPDGIYSYIFIIDASPKDVSSKDISTINDRKIMHIQI